MNGHVALVSQTGKVRRPALMQIAAAVQKQVQRDLAELWHVTATVDAFDTLPEVPADYWRVVIRDNINLPGALGAHWTEDGQPFALVQASDDVDRTCHRVSHEVLEMLIDPPGTRMLAGPPPNNPSGRVNYIVEICDPTQASAYPINGIHVCDFVTPAYFGPVAAAGARYSYSGKVTAPRQLLEGGYYSWVDLISNHLWQAEQVNGQMSLFDRGRFDPNLPIRLQADLQMREARRARPPPAPAFDASVREQHGLATASRARDLQSQISRIVRRARRQEQRTILAADAETPRA